MEKRTEQFVEINLLHLFYFPCSTKPPLFSLQKDKSKAFLRGCRQHGPETTALDLEADLHGSSGRPTYPLHNYLQVTRSLRILVSVYKTGIEMHAHTQSYWENHMRQHLVYSG